MSEYSQIDIHVEVHGTWITEEVINCWSTLSSGTIIQSEGAHKGYIVSIVTLDMKQLQEAHKYLLHSIYLKTNYLYNLII